MKKLVQIFVLGMFLAGCSGLPDISELLATPAPPPAAADTETPVASETPVPTQNLFATLTPTPLTFTPTVTSIGAELFTPTRTPEFLSTSTSGVPPFVGDYFTPQDTGFLTILYSGSIIYWNEGPCWPRNIKMSAFVADILNTDKVLLFMRLREKKNTLHITDWAGGAVMIKSGNGSFNYNIRTWNIDDYWKFKDAWIEYQLIAYDKDMNELGRSKIYDRNLTLARCMPVK